MQKLLTIPLSLLLAAALVACAPISEPETTVPSAQTETPLSWQTPEPEKTPDAEDAPHSGVLRVSDEDLISNVRVYHVADNDFNHPERVTYQVVDLNGLEPYHEFKDSYLELAGLSDVSSRIVFMTDAAVTDFRYLEIETIPEEKLGIVTLNTLYQLDVLTPEEPFAVNFISIGDIGMFRGISFVQEDGTTRYFSNHRLTPIRR